MFYYIARCITRLLLLILNLKKEGMNKMPLDGPVIVAANHVSNWDPVIIGTALSRPVHFMAKNELFNNILLGKLLTALHAFPVRRGEADRKAIRQAIDLLAAGEVIGIFPEGARQKVGFDFKAHSGVALLALKSGAKVVPTACIGTDKKFLAGWFSPLIIRMGTPIILDEYRNQKISSGLLDEISMRIMQEIKLLLDE